MPKKVSYLNTVPLDVLREIVLYLDPDSLNSLQCTCRAIDNRIRGDHILLALRKRQFRVSSNTIYGDTIHWGDRQCIFTFENSFIGKLHVRVIHWMRNGRLHRDCDLPAEWHGMGRMKWYCNGIKYFSFSITARSIGFYEARSRDKKPIMDMSLPYIMHAVRAKQACYANTIN